MTSVLLLVDVQKNMLEPPEPVPDADTVAEEIKDLLGRARSGGTTVVHIRNNGGEGDPDVPGTPGWELVHDVGLDERVVDKYECDAFAGTGLSELVPESATVTVAGMQSDYCIRERRWPRCAGATRWCSSRGRASLLRPDQARRTTSPVLTCPGLSTSA